MNIFPPEILDFSIERQVAKHSTHSQAIYITLLLVVITCFALLPYIKVDVSVQSAGILRPSEEVTEVFSPVNGKIEELNIQNNLLVTQGDTLLTLDSDALVAQEQKIQARLNEINALINDLELLTTHINKSAFTRINSPFQTAHYAQGFNTFRQKIRELNTDYLKEQRDFERSKELYDAQAIAQTEFEEATYALDQSKARLSNFHQTQLATWADEQRLLTEELNALNSDLLLLQEEFENLVITSPANGTIQNAQSLAVGGFIFSGKPLFSITPDTTLLVETYISPKDIGLLKEGLEAKFQIDAFNYNQWGFATGEVVEIAKDIQMQNEQPVFTVRCALNQTTLTLKNGYEGKLIKGMTVNARFIVAERTLWQLLYDKVDDWLNPNV